MTEVVATPAAFRPSLFRRLVGYGLIGFGCACILVLDRTDIVMNATHSLDEPAYLVVDTPIFLAEGALVAAEMPEVLADRFGEHLFVKRLGGLPGDLITLDEAGAPCVNGICYPIATKDGQPIGTPIRAGAIPEGHYALFGTAPESLDSRYMAIGLFSEEELRGRGWPLPFMPDWRSE